MKQTLFTFILTLTGYCTFAQNYYPPSGNVGVGTSSPQFPLDVRGVSGFKADVTLYGSDNTTGDSNTPSPNLIFQGTNYAGATMVAAPYETTYGRRGFSILTHSDASNTRNLVERFRITYLGNVGITYLGNVGIGTTTPDAKLAVAGIIHSQAVKVDMNGWSDYVFRPNYDLPTLTAVKAYIDKNERLPEMPSEQEVIKNGINLGDIVKLQTKKIEELTLYLIEKDKQLADQQKISLDEHVKNLQQDARMAALEKVLLSLTEQKNNR